MALRSPGHRGGGQEAAGGGRRRDLVRSARAAGGGPEQREGLAGIGRALAATGGGQRAHATQQERAREVGRERLGLWQRRGMRM